MPNHGVCWFLMTLVAQQSRQLRSSGSGLCTVYDPADFLFTLCPAWERSEAHCCLAHLLSHLSKFVRRENHGQATECIYGGKAGGFDGHRGHWDGGYGARYGTIWEGRLFWKYFMEVVRDRSRAYGELWEHVWRVKLWAGKYCLGVLLGHLCVRRVQFVELYDGRAEEPE